MKKILLSFLMIIAFATSFAQTSYKRSPSMAIHFFFDDFKTAADISANGLSNVLSNKEWTNTNHMKPGMALSYLQGLNENVDFVATLSGCFVGKQPEVVGLSGNDYFLAEVAATANLKLLTDQHRIAPFLTAGVGASQYNGAYGAFIPMGMGLQVKLAKTAFVLINSQYRIKVTDNVNNHFYHSIGVAGNVFIKKQPTPKALPAPIVATKDQDGDGVVDAADACPTIAGLASLKGCPDTDGDGIADAADKCPTLAGVAAYSGCPIPDTDGDGINDDNDKCPTVPGLNRYKGCPIPDTDGDGVNDEMDKCPTVAGIKGALGCPGIQTNEVKFQTGSAILSVQSKSILDSVVNYLNTFTAIKINIAGYTDIKGSDLINDPLSLKRAEASKAYLVSKGIDAGRITTVGEGSKQPIETNADPKSLQINRRIEVKVIQ